jgi:ATP-dependent Lon protease
VGKTSLGQSVAKATGRKYVRMALGGMRDEAEIRGHRRTYIGAMPGKVLQSLAKVGTRNPLFLLDEIDKLGMDFRGDPSSALLEVLDPEQNHTFSDHYVEVDFDLSDVMFVATVQLDEHPAGAAGPHGSHPPVGLHRGREDQHRHQVPAAQADEEQRREGRRTVGHRGSAVRDIVRYYTREAGVRSLERELSKICRKVVKGLQLKQMTPQVDVTSDNLNEFLGVRKFDLRPRREAEPGRPGGGSGVDRGRRRPAHHRGGGDARQGHHPAYRVAGRRDEGIRGGRAHRGALAFTPPGLKDEVFEKRDIHIHVPDGATPKDGPSAGAAMTTALVSALTGIPVRGDVAMTGEITLRGEVTAIGGLKEKLLAALRGGIKTVSSPRRT